MAICCECHERRRVCCGSGTEDGDWLPNFCFECCPSRFDHFIQRSKGPDGIPKPTVVILGARNEHKLRRLLAQLAAADIPHVAVYEPDAPFNGQLMAIGLDPGDRDTLAPAIKEFQMYRPDLT